MQTIATKLARLSNVPAGFTATQCRHLIHGCGGSPRRANRAIRHGLHLTLANAYAEQLAAGAAHVKAVAHCDSLWPTAQQTIGEAEAKAKAERAAKKAAKPAKAKAKARKPAAAKKAAPKAAATAKPTKAPAKRKTPAKPVAAERVAPTPEAAAAIVAAAKPAKARKPAAKKPARPFSTAALLGDLQAMQAGQAAA